MTDILGALKQINVERQTTATVTSFAQNVIDIDENFTDVRTAINALCIRVVALESLTSGNPVLTNFHVTTPGRVTAGTSLSGQSYSATYDILASTLVGTARLVGFQSLPALGATDVIVADASKREGTNTQAFTFPATADLTAEGNAYTLRLELYLANQTPGSDTPVQLLDQRVFAQAAPRADLFYWGIAADNTPANIDVNTLQSQTRLDGDITLPTWATDDQYIVFAYPDSANPVTSISIAGSFNQIQAFTLTASAITVNSVPYTTLISKKYRSIFPRK